MLNILVAYDKNRVIGDRDTIPWRLPEDMRLFKERTLGSICFMGRKTWESFRNAPKPLFFLPGRTNVIITSESSKYSKQYAEQIGDNPVYFVSLEQALRVSQALKTKPSSELYVIGGSQIYSEFLKSGWVDQVIASEVEGEHEGDAFFPELPEGFVPLSSRDYSGFKVVHYSKKEGIPL